MKISVEEILKVEADADAVWAGRQWSGGAAKIDCLNPAKADTTWESRQPPSIVAEHARAGGRNAQASCKPGRNPTEVGKMFTIEQFTGYEFGSNPPKSIADDEWGGNFPGGDYPDGIAQAISRERRGSDGGVVDFNSIVRVENGTRIIDESGAHYIFRNTEEAQAWIDEAYAGNAENQREWDDARFKE